MKGEDRTNSNVSSGIPEAEAVSLVVANPIDEDGQARTEEEEQAAEKREKRQNTREEEAQPEEADLERALEPRRGRGRSSSHSSSSSSTSSSSSLSSNLDPRAQLLESEMLEMLGPLGSFIRNTLMQQLNMEAEEVDPEQERKRRRATSIKNLVQMILYLLAPLFFLLYLENSVELAEGSLTGQVGELTLISFWIILIMLAFILSVFLFVAIYLVCVGVAMARVHDQPFSIFLLMVLFTLGPLAYLVLVPPAALSSAFGGKWITFVCATGAFIVGFFPALFFYAKKRSIRTKPAKNLLRNFLLNRAAGLFAGYLFFVFVTEGGYVSDPTSTLRNASLIAGLCGNIPILALLPVHFPLLFPTS